MSDNTSKHDKLFKALFFFALFCIFTAVVMKFDVSPIGPGGSAVGFSTFNDLVRRLFPYAKGDLYRSGSTYGLYVAFASVAFMYVGALVSALKKGSGFKIAPDVGLTVLLYIATGVVYLFFDKALIVNSRPVMPMGVLEPSYPSTHAMFAFVVCFSVSDVAGKRGRTFIAAVLRLVGILVCVFRAMCGLHWLTDVVAAVLVSLSLLNFYEAFAFGE